jgi:hypothetical protein
MVGLVAAAAAAPADPQALGPEVGALVEAQGRRPSARWAGRAVVGAERMAQSPVVALA